MKKLLICLAPLMLFSSPALAQYEPPTTELTPYEQTRYGSSLWEVPRQPYESRYRVEKDTSRLSESPPDAVPSQGSYGQRSRGQSPINTSPPGNLQERKTQQRFQSRMQWENEQRKISERSRYSAPGQKSPGK